MMILLAAVPSTLSIEPISRPTTYALRPTILVLLILIYPVQLFLADVNYGKGKKYFDAGQIGTALPYLKKAVDARPGLDLFHSTLGEAYAATGQKDLALQELKINLKLNPYHLNFYKSRAKIYLTLASTDPKYHVQAADELEAARKLAPTDPKLAYNLGLIYTRLDQTDEAERQLLDAISLKSNYSEPYYALTLLYEQTKQLSKIKPILNEAKSNLATYSAQLKEKIEKYANN